MTMIVTGFAGFIGSHLTEKLLENGYHVIGIDNNADNIKRNIKEHPNLTIINEDINCLPPLNNKIDCIMHLAGLADIVPSIIRPYEYHHNNATGTISMLEVARQHGAKFIYAASSSCYGNNSNYPTIETDECNPQYPYALTKYLGEQYVMHYHKVYKLPVISLRLFNVYGPRSRTSGTYGAVFGTFLAQKINHKPLTIVGDGSQSRDFIFVTDAVDAFIKAMESPIDGEIFNIGSGQTYSIKWLVELMGYPRQIMYIPKRPGEPQITQASITKAQEKFQWQPRVSFNEGVKIMLANIDYWKDAPVWDNKSIEIATKEWFKYLGNKHETKL